MNRKIILAAALALGLGACGGDDQNSGGGTPTPTPSSSPTPTPTPAPTPSYDTEVIASGYLFTGMTFLPDGRYLVTEQKGNLRLGTTDGTISQPIGTIPGVLDVGDGGLLDVVLDPSYATNGIVYLSFTEGDSTTSFNMNLAVAKAKLTLSGSTATLSGLTVIWRQDRTPGGGNFGGEDIGGRMAFGPDGFLYMTVGDRYLPDAAQDLGQVLGKTIRITADGAPAPGNPFIGVAGAKPEIWTLGNRDGVGLAFGSDGRLFESERGPGNGDEFNLLEAGKNYGWPAVSEGSSLSMTYPPHSSNPAYNAPLLSWKYISTISGLFQSKSNRFGLRDSFVLVDNQMQDLVPIGVSGNSAKELDRLDVSRVTVDVEEAPDGNIYFLGPSTDDSIFRLTVD